MTHYHVVVVRPYDDYSTSSCGCKNADQAESIIEKEVNKFIAWRLDNDNYLQQKGTEAVNAKRNRLNEWRKVIVNDEIKTVFKLSWPLRSIEGTTTLIHQQIPKLICVVEEIA